MEVAMSSHSQMGMALLLQHQPAGPHPAPGATLRICKWVISTATANWISSATGMEVAMSSHSQMGMALLLQHQPAGPHPAPGATLRICKWVISTATANWISSATGMEVAMSSHSQMGMALLLQHQPAGPHPAPGATLRICKWVISTATANWISSATGMEVAMSSHSQMGMALLLQHQPAGPHPAPGVTLRI